jgi:3-oxoadipate enol-lactonase
MAKLVINFEDLGQGDVILAMHSLGGSLRMWDSFTSAASPAWRVLRFDSRQHGGDTRVDSFSIDANAHDAIALLDQLEIKRAHLLGISMGAHTALRIAQLWPQRLASMVLANGSPGGALDAKQRLQALQEKISSIGFESFANEYVRSRLSRSATPQVFEDYIASTLRLGAKAYVETLGSILAQNFTQSLSSMTMPSLVLSGTEDISTPPATAAALAQVIPGAQLRILENAGHFSCLDQPQVFNKTVLEFFMHVMNKNSPKSLV